MYRMLTHPQTRRRNEMTRVGRVMDREAEAADMLMFLLEIQAH